jgi:hypothetical protein
VYILARNHDDHICRHTRQYYINMDIKGTEFKDSEWIKVAQDKLQCQAFVNTIVDFWIPYNVEISWPSK